MKDAGAISVTRMRDYRSGLVSSKGNKVGRSYLDLLCDWDFTVSADNTELYLHTSTSLIR